MKRLLLVAMFAVATNGVAQEGRWEHFLATERSFIKLDNRSIKRSGSKVTAWFQLDYREQQSTGTYPEKRYWSAVWRVAINCKEETMLDLHVTRYAGLGMQGEQVSSFNNQDRPESYDPIIPDTVGEHMRDRLCKK